MAARSNDYSPAVPAQGSNTLQLLKKLTPEIQKALPNGMDADRIARLVMTEIRKNPKLADCTQQSFAGALLTASALGLEPGVQGECYLVPYNDRRRGLECQLIIGYQGVVKLFWQHPRAQGIRTEAVYENDTINEYTKGTGGRFRYTPTFGDRGAVIAYYAEVKVAGVAEPLWDVFTPQQIKELRRGKEGGNGDIPDPEHWMERKTALKQVLKLAPKTTRLDMAIRADENSGRELVRSQGMDMSALAASGTDVDYDEAPTPIEGTVVDSPPDDVVFASKDQLAALNKIRADEKLDGAAWSDFVISAGAGVEAYESDAKLTFDQAAAIIGLFA